LLQTLTVLMVTGVHRQACSAHKYQEDHCYQRHRLTTLRSAKNHLDSPIYNSYPQRAGAVQLA
jgi:hypothetical protein